jgi:hypothetical protein
VRAGKGELAGDAGPADGDGHRRARRPAHPRDRVREWNAQERLAVDARDQVSRLQAGACRRGVGHGRDHAHGAVAVAGLDLQPEAAEAAAQGVALVAARQRIEVAGVGVERAQGRVDRPGEHLARVRRA